MVRTEALTEAVTTDRRREAAVAAFLRRVATTSCEAAETRHDPEVDDTPER